MVDRYADYFPDFIKRGIEAELLDERLAQFDLLRLANTLDSSRDLKFGYLGLQTLYDRYFLHVQDTAHRVAPGILHACRDGACAERN